MRYVLRLLRLIAGLFLFALGTYCTIQASIGLAPWEAFSMGLSLVSGISFGNMVVLSGLAIIALDLLLREKIGIGTILNALLIGKFIDLLSWLQPLPKMESFAGGVALLLVGEVVLCLGSWLYIGAGLSCGPRDALMVGLSRRFPVVPVGAIRGCIEGSVLLIGWLLGAPVGLGTVIAVFGIGFILQGTFRLLHFDVKAVEHESLLDTFRLFKTAVSAK